MSFVYELSRIGKSIEVESSLVAARGLEEGEMSSYVDSLFMGSP